MSTETWSIHKSYEDERERGVGTNLSKAVFPKTVARGKTWAKGVLPTKQQKQAAGIATLTGAGGYAGTKYKQAKTYGDPTIPPAVQRARRFAKAQRRVDPEYDRARRRGLLQGAAVGGAIPLGMVGSKTFQTVGAADMKGKPRSWKGKSIAVRATPTGKFPRGRAGALGGAAALAGGAALSQRRGTRERNRTWT